MDQENPAVGRRKHATRRDYRARCISMTHGAYSLVRGYYAGQIDQRTAVGKLTRDMEAEFAAHCGFESIGACPVTLRGKIQLAVGSWLFLMTYCPEPGAKTAGRELATTANTLNRILSELGLSPPEPKAIDLRAYLRQAGGDGQ